MQTYFDHNPFANPGLDERQRHIEVVVDALDDLRQGISDHSEYDALLHGVEQGIGHSLAVIVGSMGNTSSDPIMEQTVIDTDKFKARVVTHVYPPDSAIAELYQEEQGHLPEGRIYVPMSVSIENELGLLSLGISSKTGDFVEAGDKKFSYWHGVVPERLEVINSFLSSGADIIGHFVNSI